MHARRAMRTRAQQKPPTPPSRPVEPEGPERGESEKSTHTHMCMCVRASQPASQRAGEPMRITYFRPYARAQMRTPLLCLGEARDEPSGLAEAPRSHTRSPHWMFLLLISCQPTRATIRTATALNAKHLSIFTGSALAGGRASERARKRAPANRLLVSLSGGAQHYVCVVRVLVLVLVVDPLAGHTTDSFQCCAWLPSGPLDGGCYAPIWCWSGANPVDKCGRSEIWPITWKLAQ